jgi:xylulokinase
MTGQMAVDTTIASRTLLFDQRSLTWSAELLDLFDLPPTLFPPTSPGGSAAGMITRQCADETGLPLPVLCALGGHDHLCATFAAGAHTWGAVSDSTGSANALLMLLPAFSGIPALAERGYACYPHVLKGQTVLKGGLKAAGNALDWLARLFAGPGMQPAFSDLERAAAEGVGRKAGPLWLPHLIGSGTPQGDRFSRAAAVGLQFEHTAGDIYRGMLESLAYWLRHNLEEMQSLTRLQTSTITLTGGATRIALLSRLKASVLNRPVRVPEIPEAAAAGAALLAGLGSGLFQSPSEALDSLRYNCLIIEPDQNLNAWYDQMYQQAYLPLYQALQPVHTTLNRFSSMT